MYQLFVHDLVFLCLPENGLDGVLVGIIASYA
jgi:hypothetical protein